MFPPAPAFTGALRLARLSDISRIGVVAAASFYHSSWFAYERPYYDKYPLDTLASYRNSFRNAVLDPNAVVLVVEDTLNRSEATHAYDALAKIYPSFEDQIPADLLIKDQAVVSVASLSLISDSPRHGQFQPDGDGPPSGNDPVMSRDKDPVGGKNMDEVLHPQELEIFKGRLVIDMMVTHPAYWRKGHASTMTKWFIELAKMDQIGVGVAGAPLGKLLFTALGFKEAKTLEIPGYDAHPEPVYAWLGLFNSTDAEGVGGGEL